MGKDNLPKTGGLFLMKRGANGEIAGRNSMDKEKNEMIVELKKTLNRIYDRFEQRMDPVSYTHLDVYKRQFLC